MDFLTDWLTNWLKELLIGGIMGNLEGLFDTVNTQVGEIAAQVGTTPAAWHAGVFSLIRQLSETVILPIAGIALMTNYVKCSYTPGLEHYIDGFTSFYSFLEKKYKIIFSNAVQYLSAVSANFTESQILEKPVGSPLLCSRRICYSGQDPFLYAIICQL